MTDTTYTPSTTSNDTVSVTLDKPEQRRRERRLFPTQVEVRSGVGHAATIVGYASVFDRPYRIIDWRGDYHETVAPSAFNKTLSDGADVRYLFDHAGLPMARTKSGTLRLSVDETGLLYEAQIDRRQQAAADLAIAIERGDVDQSSMAFDTVQDEWAEDRSTRRLTEVKLYDVSSVTYPANEDTTAGIRDGRWLAEITRNAALMTELRDGGTDVDAGALDEAIAALVALRPAAPRPRELLRAVAELERLRLAEPR
jgi:HK97 family phage prohead protease